MVNIDVLKQRLLLLSEYINDLKEAAENVSYQDFAKDKIMRRYIERTLQLSVEACLDIGSHIIADLALREPINNKDIFVVLIENGFLDENRVEDFEKMAGFRNVVVHDYVRLDPEIVYHVLQKSLPDLQLYACSIREKFLS